MALAGIDRSLRTLESFRTASSEAALFSSSMQAALASVQDIPAMIGPTLLSAATTSNPAQVNAAAADAREKFLGAVQTLNVQVGDRFVFSGTMTDTKPFADGANMLAALGTAIAGETTAAGVAAQVSAWFAAPVGGGGFLDTGYLGGDTALAAFRIGPDETAELDAVGSDPALRGVLEGLALAALLAEGALSSDTIERSRLARTAGETILGAAIAADRDARPRRLG